MDPLTQGVLGSSVTQTTASKKEITLATIMGCLGGMAADLDIFIRSSSDPLLYIEFHRHFTHSLFFIPIGGAIISFLLWISCLRKRPFKKIYKYTTIGYATHALLDGCTSYGTLLLWPISDHRFAWDSISIIDPLVTIPLLIGTLLTVYLKNKKWAYSSLSFVALYFVFGFVQNDRVKEQVYALAKKRGHQIERVRVTPSLANLIVWRTFYQYEEDFYVDSIRMNFFGTSKVFEGGKVRRFNFERILNEVSRESFLYKDLKRFSWFADKWLITHPNNANLIMDLRYSSLPSSLKPLWGIELPVEPELGHAKYKVFPRNINSETLKDFLKFFD